METARPERRVSSIKMRLLSGAVSTPLMILMMLASPAPKWNSEYVPCCVGAA